MSNLIKNINVVLDFCAEYGSKKALKTSSMPAKVATQQLIALSRSLWSSLEKPLQDKFQISISYGSGYFPRVPWVALTPLGKKVSNSVSVCLCFGKTGNGIVVGAMFPHSRKDGEFKTASRLIGDESYIIINGGNNNSKYSNKFINPKDFSRTALEEGLLMDHIMSSVQLMEHYLETNKTRQW